MIGISISLSFNEVITDLSQFSLASQCRSNSLEAHRYVFIILTLLCALSQDATVTSNVAMILTTSNKSGNE